jgi:hypothetical protein
MSGRGPIVVEFINTIRLEIVLTYVVFLVHYFKTLGNYFVGDYIVGNYQNCWER